MWCCSPLDIFQSFRGTYSLIFRAAYGIFTIHSFFSALMVEVADSSGKLVHIHKTR